MTRLALIHNPRSGPRKNHPALKAALADATRIAPMVHMAMPETLDDLQRAIDRAAAVGATILAVSGGDGTVREVLTALARMDGWHPSIALVASGKTNLIARDVGAARGGHAGIREVAEAAAAGTLEARAVLRRPIDVTCADDNTPPLRGFFFGAGALTQGTDLTRNRLHANGIRQGYAVTVAIGAMLYRSLRPRPGHGAPGTGPMRVWIDGEPGREGERFIFLASSLERMILRMGLFWEEGEAPLRFTEIDGPPDRLPRALIPVLRGKPKAWMHDAGYRSGRADALTLALDTPFVVDGEVFPAPRSGALTLSAGPAQTFVAP